MADLKALAETLVSLTVKEANELAQILENDHGIKPAAVAAAPAATAAAAAPAVVEKTEFDVVLVAAGDKKLEVVKEVKNLLGLGLKEAKDLVDSAPSVLKAGAPKADAEAIKAKLTEAGAKVELK